MGSGARSVPARTAAVKRLRPASQQRLRAAPYVTGLLALLLAAPAARSQGIPVGNSQKEAALEYLQALADNDPQAIALALHPADLKALRLRLLKLTSTRGGAPSAT